MKYIEKFELGSVVNKPDFDRKIDEMIDTINAIIDVLFYVDDKPMPMQAQCWICPKCHDDHFHGAPCKSL